MFGYVTPDKSQIRQQDYVLYRAFYCGICKTIGDRFGQFARYTVSYDSAFLGALISDCLDYPQKIEEQSCIGNPFNKKPMIVTNPLMEKISAVTVILARYKLRDDVIDGDKSKRVAIKILSGAYNKAKEIAPECDKIVAYWYDELRKCEKSGETSVDKVSHCFAMMMKNLFADLLQDKADDNILSLAYNIGKFVYIADALDDVDEDFKSGNYNALLSAYPGYENRRQFIEDNKKDLEFLFAFTVNKAIASFNDRKYNQSYSLLENVIYYGLRKKTQELFYSQDKLPRPKI